MQQGGLAPAPRARRGLNSLRAGRNAGAGHAAVAFEWPRMGKTCASCLGLAEVYRLLGAMMGRVQGVLFGFCESAGEKGCDCFSVKKGAKPWRVGGLTALRIGALRPIRGSERRFCCNAERLVSGGATGLPDRRLAAGVRGLGRGLAPPWPPRSPSPPAVMHPRSKISIEPSKESSIAAPAQWASLMPSPDCSRVMTSLPSWAIPRPQMTQRTPSGNAGSAMRPHRLFAGRGAVSAGMCPVRPSLIPFLSICMQRGRGKATIIGKCLV